MVIGCAKYVILVKVFAVDFFTLCSLKTSIILQAIAHFLK